MTAESHTRRTVLTTGAAATVGAVALTACGAGGSSQPAPNPSAPPAAPGKPLAALADVPVGQAKAVTTPDGKDAIVSRPTETTVACFSAICTHQGCKVAPSGAELKCPCHGSVFDALTGDVKQGPAKDPLPKLPVKIDNTQIVTA